MRKYDFYSDPRHGWLKVERRELVELGIENQISGYSYQKGDYVYLEEDGDASKFADAWEAKHQVKLMNSLINYHIADRASKIRRYQPFSPQGSKDATTQVKTLLAPQITAHDSDNCKCDLTPGGYGLCYAGQWLEGCITDQDVLQDLGRKEQTQ